MVNFERCVFFLHHFRKLPNLSAKAGKSFNKAFTQAYTLLIEKNEEALLKQSSKDST